MPGRFDSARPRNRRERGQFTGASPTFRNPSTAGHPPLRLKLQVDVPFPLLQMNAGPGPDGPSRPHVSVPPLLREVIQGRAIGDDAGVLGHVVPLLRLHGAHVLLQLMDGRAREDQLELVGDPPNVTKHPHGVLKLLSMPKRVPATESRARAPSRVQDQLDTRRT